MSPYYWFLLGMVLIAAELLAPGVFLLWIGLAGVLMAALTWLVPLGVVVQAAVFAVLALGSCLVYWKFLGPNRHGPTGHDRHLNRRAEQHLGKRYTLETAIANGSGKARVGDSLWVVEGPDLPAGSVVEVTGIDGTRLKVRAPLAE